MADVVELDKLVMLLVGCFADFFDLAVLAKDGLEILILRLRVQVEDHERALVEILVGGIVFWDGVVDI